MNTKFKNLFGCILIPIGLLVIAFSSRIVFSGLERLIGIEAIVGKENVVYQPDGSYYFTNPRAMVEWVLSVAMPGMLILAVGIWLSGFRLKFPARKGKDISK
jgi:hypothetical protein